MKLSEVGNGDVFNGVVGVSEKAFRTTKNGSNFIKLTLCDSSGSMGANLWDASQDDFDCIAEGGGLEIRAKVSEYQGVLQMSVDAFEVLGSDDPQLSSLMPELPVGVSVTDLEYRLEQIIKHNLDKVDRKFIEALFSDEVLLRLYKAAPAARNNHHAFRHGLLLHSLEVADIALAMLRGIHAKPEVDVSMLTLAALLHDIGKVYELKWGAATLYTTHGKLLGHSIMGADIVEKVATQHGYPVERKLMLKHCILSHHGRHEWGAAVLPQSVEANLLHLVDLAESRIDIFRDMSEGMREDGWTEKNYALGNTALYFGDCKHG